MHPLLLDLEGAAELIAVSPHTARQWAKAGNIPGTKVGGQWRFWSPALLTAVVGPEAADHFAHPVSGIPEPGIVGVTELAEALGIPQRTVAILLRRGEIPAKKFGYQWRAFWPLIRDRIAAGQPLTTSKSSANDPVIT
jgi:excisionase family DNA binding protein